MHQPDIDPVFKSVIGMGVVQKIYKQRNVSMFSEILSSLFMMIMSPLFFYEVSILYKRDHAINGEIIMFVLAAPVFMYIGIYSLGKVISRWSDSAVVYQNGFAYSHKSNLTIFRWSEITSITAVATNFRALGFIPAGKVREYWIAKANTKLRLASTLDEVDNLLADIRKNSFPHMYDRVKQELDDGKAIEFGLVTIDKNGVKSGGKEYLWLDLAQAGLANGRVYYVPKKSNVISGIHVTTQHVPNFDVLLALSNDLIRQTGQPS